MSLILWPFVAAALGAYLGAYLKRKGENLATREDLAHLTRATEEIKAQISSDVWDRQRRWETQRDVMFDLVRALEVGVRLLSVMLATFRATAGDDFDEVRRATHRAKVRQEWMEADDSLAHVVAVAGLVSTPQLQSSLVDVSREMKRLALEALAGKDPEPSIPVVQKRVYEIIATVRRELRLGDGRSEGPSVELHSMPR